MTREALEVILQLWSDEDETQPGHAVAPKSVLLFAYSRDRDWLSILGLTGRRR